MVCWLVHDIVTWYFQLVASFRTFNVICASHIVIKLIVSHNHTFLYYDCLITMHKTVKKKLEVLIKNFIFVFTISWLTETMTTANNNAINVGLLLSIYYVWG